MSKIVYIAHAIGGDIEANLADLRRILRIINLNIHPLKVSIGFDFSDVIPIVPYYADIVSLDDNNPEERSRGIENDKALIETGVFDELWLTGSKISFGMSCEVIMFEKLCKPVVNYIGWI